MPFMEWQDKNKVKKKQKKSNDIAIFLLRHYRPKLAPLYLIETLERNLLNQVFDDGSTNKVKEINLEWR